MYETSDLALASYLTYVGHQCVSVEETLPGSGRKKFIFNSLSKSGDVNKSAQDFMTGVASVEPKSYFKYTRQLKYRIYNE